MANRTNNIQSISNIQDCQVLSLVEATKVWLSDFGNSFTCPYSCKSATNDVVLEHKIGRFMVRAFRGVSCGIAKGYRFRWFVLTESDMAIALGIEFGAEFHRFMTWLRKLCPDVQYLVVEHRQGDKLRRNWHVLCYGSDKLPVLAIRQYWLEHFKSTVTGMAEVRDVGKAIQYLAGYLSDREKFVRAWCSQGWVFRGWIGMSKQYHRSYSDYPSVADLTALSLMSPSNRAGALDWLLNTGYMTEAECVKAMVAVNDDHGGDK